jgi:hypothetical protein
METQENRRKSQKRKKDAGELFQACELAQAAAVGDTLTPAFYFAGLAAAAGPFNLSIAF